LPAPKISNTFLTKHNEPKPWYVRDEVDHSRKDSIKNYKSFHDPLQTIKKGLSSKSQDVDHFVAKPSISDDSQSQTLESLRAQRLLRESRERERERKLLSETYSELQNEHKAPRHHSHSKSDKKNLYLDYSDEKDFIKKSKEA